MSLTCPSLPEGDGFLMLMRMQGCGPRGRARLGTDRVGRLMCAWGQQSARELGQVRQAPGTGGGRGGGGSRRRGEVCAVGARGGP